MKRVAFIVDLATSFGRRVLEGVHSHPARQDWILLADSWGDVGRDDLLDETTLDGIIIDSDEPELLRILENFAGPVVDLRAGLRTSLSCQVTVDYAQVGRTAAEHLRDRGFTSLAFLGTSRWPPSEVMGRSFMRAASEFASDILRSQTPRRWSGQQSTHRDELAEWLAGIPKPCGILAADDITGRRLLQACRKANWKVPDEVAVLGVGDYEMVTTVSDPTLSSVIVPARAIGLQAADCLHQFFQGCSYLPDSILPSTSVAARRSTDALAWEDPLLREALSWLREHLSEPLRVPNLANHLCVSRRLLEQRFRETLGHGPAEQLRRVRVRKAENLLRETDLGLGPIAKMCGMGTAERLCVLFRQYLQVTPGSYRNMHASIRA